MERADEGQMRFKKIEINIERKGIKMLVSWHSQTILRAAKVTSLVLKGKCVNNDVRVAKVRV